MSTVEQNKTKCSRCHCMKPNVDFIGATGTTVKTCIRCRNDAKERKKNNKAEHAYYSKIWRKRHPCYDKRDRKEYRKLYYARKKQEKLDAVI